MREKRNQAERVLEVIGAGRDSARLAAEATGIGQSVVYPVLVVLRREGFIRERSERRRYAGRDGVRWEKRWEATGKGGRVPTRTKRRWFEGVGGERQNGDGQLADQLTVPNLEKGGAPERGQSTGGPTDSPQPGAEGGRPEKRIRGQAPGTEPVPIFPALGRDG